MDQIKIGKFIAEIRKEKKLTQERLAEKLDVSINAVSKWERGLNLPDVQLMPKLCEILGISLNELFAGNKVKEKDKEKQFEKNIIDLINFNNVKNKKYKILSIFLIILSLIFLVILLKFVLIKKGYMLDDKLKYTKPYITNYENVIGDVNINYFAKKNINFDIGANKFGYAVFKNPKLAFKSLKKDYKQGIKLIEHEFNLLPLNNFNYKQYKTYGWQVTTGTEMEREQAKFVTLFLDIYENSFN